MKNWVGRWTSGRFAKGALAENERPWLPDRPTVLSLIEAACVEGKLHELSFDSLADIEERGFGFVAGAKDSIFGALKSDSDVPGRTLGQAVEAAVRRPSAGALAHLCGCAEAQSLASCANDLTTQLRAKSLDPGGLLTLGRLLASEAPTVEPVKLGILLIGVSARDDARDLLLALGRSDELTVFAAVALRATSPQADRDIWQLGKTATGWGRIHAIEHLAGTKDSDIQGWLLREGASNAVMDEYTALACATDGDLVAALRDLEPDPALLKGAGTILRALVSDISPAAGMSDYPDGAAATRLYIARVAADPRLALDRFLTVRDFVRFADGKADAASSWPASELWDIRTTGGAYLKRPGWHEAAEAGFDAPHPFDFWQARQVGEALGLDTWAASFARQAAGHGSEWFDLMRTEDVGRIEQTLALARAQLDLAQLASGPTPALGIGREYVDDHALGFILQRLRDFPGRGGEFVAAALRSRGRRLRNQAIFCLDAWPRKAWPPEARFWLARAMAEEPDPKIRARLAALRDGRALPDDA